MGNSKSKPETPEERRERLQREYGVLMPPSFVNGSRLPVTSQAALQYNQAIVPSLLDYLWATNPGTRLLEEYLQPGISMRIPTTSTNPGGDILVCLQPVTTKSDTSDVLPSNTIGNSKLQSSSIIATHRYHPLQMEVHVPTHRSPCSLQLSTSVSNFGLAAQVPLGLDHWISTGTRSTSTGGGWIETKYKRQLLDGEVDFVVSSWMTMSSIRTLLQRKNWINSKKTHCANPPVLQLQVGLDYQQSVIAAQADIPITDDFLSGNVTQLQVPNLQTMVSINLNHQSPPANHFPSMINATFVDEEDDDDDTEQIAPLWLSLKHSPKSWILNLSQVLVFDRPVLNPFDERAPNIRQTLGWVVQVDKVQHDNNTETKTSWSAGATFQMNRSTAFKAVLVDGYTLTYGAILKRWTQPRITLSLINSFNFLTGQHSQVGFGLELETVLPTVDDNSTTEYPDHPSVPPRQSPQTKIRIPKQKIH